MSYIDTLDHTVLGEIGYLPVYLLNQDDLGENNEFNSPKGTLLLGGGGGEHPALSIKNLNFVVLYYFYLLIDMQKPSEMKELEYLKIKRESKLDFIEGNLLLLMDNEDEKNSYLYDKFSVLQFNNWTIDDFANIANYRKENEILDFEFTEEWLIFKIGEFIVKNHPELNNFTDIEKELNKAISELKINR